MHAEVTRGDTGVAAAQPPAVPAPAAPAVQASSQEVAQAVGQITAFLQSSSASVEFSMEEQSGRVVIRIVDEQTRQLIRQIPSEDLLTIARALDRVQGLLVSTKA
jgi:flagellar protein FlaG